MHSVYDCSNCFSGDCSNTMTKRADDGQSKFFQPRVSFMRGSLVIFKDWRAKQFHFLKFQYMYINKTCPLCRRVFV